MDEVVELEGEVVDLEDEVVELEGEVETEVDEVVVEEGDVVRSESSDGAGENMMIDDL